MKNLLTTLSLGVIATATASAADVTVGNGSQAFIISTSQTWTADNVYRLNGQVYIGPGATLTIEPGTVIASMDGGSLAIAKGGQIFAEGYAGAPITFTSDDDQMTWPSPMDPSSGTWREAANEWGNLTIMGDAYIAENAIASNSASPSASNFANMEGLTPPAAQASIAQYGGGNDDDDSGTLAYCSFRYGGRVVALQNELNGLSLGGIGRGTDIHHVEIMNNVDDGIEIWGGTVNLKYFSIWNIGDDSLDIDQGWRGKAQFGLIVQGYSRDDSQGSGVGDNAIETDGAEDSDYQPVTTTSMYNLTVIGQPVDGDGLTAWRDNARVQYHNSLFMFCGEKVVRFDGDDGDGASGYGHNGTLDWATTWNTPYTAFSTVNAPANPAAFYTSQTSGNLIEFTDSYFYGNSNSQAYTEADARGVFAAANNNTKDLGVSPAGAPVNGIAFAAPVSKGGKTMVQIIGLDPRPTGGAATASNMAPADGFFTPAPYKGAFNPDESGTWLEGWAASVAFGFVGGEAVGTNYCQGNDNSNGVGAQIRAYGSTNVAANDLTLEASSVPANQFGIFLLSRTEGFLPSLGGTNGALCLGTGSLARFNTIRQASALGVFSLDLDLTAFPQGINYISVLPGESWSFQAWFRDLGGQANTTDGVTVTFN